MGSKNGQAEEAIEKLTALIEHYNNELHIEGGKLYGKRGEAYLANKQYDEAIADLEKAVASKDVQGFAEYDHYYGLLREACREKQETQTFDERMAPYAEMLKRLKTASADAKEPLDIYRMGDVLGLHVWDTYAAELIVAMIIFEEYDMFNSLMSTTYVDESPSSSELLNSRVRPQFSWWEPTPFYFLTTSYARSKIKDLNRTLFILLFNGANPNKTAGDGTTPLWNATNHDFPIEVMKIILENGADPNEFAIEDGHPITPLSNCFRRRMDETWVDPCDGSENPGIPYGMQEIEKAKMLLEYGADPNLSKDEGFGPALIMAIYSGFPKDRKGEPESSEMLDFIEFLIQKGADPNYAHNYIPPLSAAKEMNLPEVERLLERYGATETTVIKNKVNYIFLTEKRAEGKLPVGCSKFFGEPDVWDGFRAPVASEEAGGHALLFMCQINCAQAAPYDTDGILPKTGMLYFFYDRNAGNPGTVLYYDGDLSKLKPLPHGEEQSLPEYEILFNEDTDTEEFKLGGHSLLGEPSDPQQMGLGTDIPDNWRMLLELDSCFGEDVDFNFGGDCGMLCYFIDKKKLAEKDFSGAWYIEYGY